MLKLIFFILRIQIFLILRTFFKLTLLMKNPVIVTDYNQYFIGVS